MVIINIYIYTYKMNSCNTKIFISVPNKIGNSNIVHEHLGHVETINLTFP